MHIRSKAGPWILGALIAGILICAALIAVMLLTRRPVFTEAQFVREAVLHAHV